MHIFVARNQNLMGIIDWIIYLILALNAAYLLLFAFAAKAKRRQPAPTAKQLRSFVFLIPAYREDAVIEECASSCLNQNYPRDLYEVVVISDKMLAETNLRLSKMPIKLIEARFEKSTKSKSLNLALSQLEGYDLCVVMDADNVIQPDFLTQVNNAFAEGRHDIFQAHRTAKNLNTDLAILDAASEEINNSIFRLGHANLGLSAALIGSGMIFDFDVFKQKMKTITAVGGFDRNLELSFLKEGHSIGYIPHVPVYDEKTQEYTVFSNQRRRWISAQLHYFSVFAGDLPKELIKGNLDFCNKLMQQLVLPRIISLGTPLLLGLATAIFMPEASPKWFTLFFLVSIALLISIPKSLWNKRLLRASLQLPKAFWVIFLTFFKLKGANKNFIHTQHGVKK